jgi:hypothetical protein
MPLFVTTHCLLQLLHPFFHDSSLPQELFYGFMPFGMECNIQEGTENKETLCWVMQCSVSGAYKQAAVSSG